MWILFSRIALKDIFATLKFMTRAWFSHINKGQSYHAISRGFYFHETSHMQSFAKIKPSHKFPNLQHAISFNQQINLLEVTMKLWLKTSQCLVYTFIKSILFVSLAVWGCVGWSSVPFYIPTKLLSDLNMKNQIVMYQLLKCLCWQTLIDFQLSISKLWQNYI